MITLKVVCINCGEHDEGLPCFRRMGDGFIFFDEHDFQLVQEVEA